MFSAYGRDATKPRPKNAPARLNGVQPASLACFIAVLWLLLGLAVTAPAATDERLERLPDKYRKWLEEDVVYIITERETNAFLDLVSAEEREAFIAAFWRRRDPNPVTPVNEFQEEHSRRTEHANRFMGREAAVPGWKTDRGRMYIILGEPRDKQSFRSIPNLYPSEVWFYDGDREKQLPAFYLLFFQPGHAGAYRLFDHNRDEPESLIPFSQEDRMEAYSILQDISPDLAHASITFRADRASYPGTYASDQSALDNNLLMADIYRSPYRNVDANYADGARLARGLVESEYMFNYVPNFGTVDILPGPGGASFAHYSIEIDPQHLTLVKDENRYYTSFDVRAEATSDSGEKTLFQFSKLEYLELTESQLGQVASLPFAYRNSFPLVGGDHLLRIILKNRARSEYTIFEAPIHVPDTKVGGTRLGQAVLVYNVEELAGSGTGTFRTYQIGSLRLHPNAKRTYTIGQPLMVYIPVEGASPEHQLVFRLTSSEDPSEVLQSKATPVGVFRKNLSVETMSLDDMVGGHYRLRIALTTPTEEVIQEQSVDFDISPRTDLARPWVMYGSNAFKQLPTVRVALAEQQLIMGHEDRAQELYELAFEEDPALPAVVLHQARRLLSEGKARQAVEILEPAYERAKDDFDVTVALADAHYQLQNCPRAVELFEAALGLRRPGPTVLNALAACHSHLGNDAEAVRYLKQSLAMDPEQGEAQSLLEKLQDRQPQRR